MEPLPLKNKEEFVWYHKLNRTCRCLLELNRDPTDPGTIIVDFRFEFRFEKDKTKAYWSPAKIEICISPSPSADDPKEKNYHTPKLVNVQPATSLATVTHGKVKSLDVRFTAAANPSAIVGGSLSNSEQYTESAINIDEKSNYTEGNASWVYTFKAKDYFSIDMENRVSWDNVVKVIGIQIKVTAKSRGNPSYLSPTFLLEPDNILKTKNKLTVGVFGETRAGKSSFINALYQAHGRTARPANVIDTLKNDRGTQNYRVYSTSTPLSKELPRPFIFVDTKGEVFDVEIKPSMEKLELLCHGLMNHTDLTGNDTNILKKNVQPENKLTVAILTIDARAFVSDQFKQYKWPLTWLYGPSYLASPLVGYLNLKKKIEEFIGTERSCYLLFTHMDYLSKQQCELLTQKLQEHNISPVDVVYASKSCELEEVCDHWTEETLEAYRRLLENIEVSY